MKRVFSLLLLFFLSLMAKAQHSQATLVITRTDGEKVSVPASELDRITFDYTDGSVVDMGLSVKWASCNLDITQDSRFAPSPESNGGYYGWADPAGFLTEADVNLYPDAERPLDICGGDYDIATKMLGKGWRLPTKAEFDELLEKCTWERTALNGVKGMKAIAVNGNWLFFPYAGYRYKTSCFQQGEYGYYWTGSRHEKNANYAADLNIGADICKTANQIIYNGCPVRAVKVEE